MGFSYLNEENIFDLFDQAREYTDGLTKPFPEYARIARNKPHPNVPKRFPKTTDGTSASMISKKPRRIVQQLPTGTVETDDEFSKWPIIADFVGRTQILPLANTEYDLIQKCWLTIEAGDTFGSKAIYTPMIDHDGIISPDYLGVYWGDIFLPKGYKSGYDLPYQFMRTWLQESDIDSLIASEESRAKEARAEGTSYKSFWDLEALRDIKYAIESKDEAALTPAEKELQLDADGIEIVTGFQRGVGATFFTFNPKTKRILKRKPNKDLRGKMPIDWYYEDIDGSNPLGRSLLELIGPLQNLIDSDMQAYQYNRAIALQPPVNVYGNINEKRIVYAPNAINKITDPNGRIEAMEINTDAIREYPNMYGLQISQLMKNTNGDPATAISSEVGDPMAGKTPTAIKARNAATSTDDNATLKSWEAFFENWYETALNLHFGEKTGKEELMLDGETADKLRDLEERGYLEPGYVSEDNKIIVDYDEITEVLHFRVDASTSKVNDEQKQLEALQVLVQTLDGSQSLSAVVPTDKKLAVWNAIVANSGVEKSEQLKVSEEELEEMQRLQNEQAAAAQAVETAPAVEEYKIAEDLPAEDELSVTDAGNAPDADDAQIGAELRELGVPEDMIDEVFVLIEKGYSQDEIMASIQGVMSKQAEEAVNE